MYAGPMVQQINLKNMKIAIAFYSHWIYNMSMIWSSRATQDRRSTEGSNMKLLKTLALILATMIITCTLTVQYITYNIEIYYTDTEITTNINLLGLEYINTYSVD